MSIPHCNGPRDGWVGSFTDMPTWEADGKLYGVQEATLWFEKLCATESSKPYSLPYRDALYPIYSKIIQNI